MTKSALLLGVLVVAGAGGVAEAATRTICVDLRFRDDRTNCAGSSATGNRRGCSPGGNDLTARGAIFELWDYDADGSDEYIGSFSYWHVGGSCATFEWDSNGAANAEGEAQPDVYARYMNIVYGPVNARAVTARQSDGSAHPVVSFRDTRATDCGSTCWIAPGSYLVVSTDTTSTAGKVAMALDSAQHVLELFGAEMNGDLIMRTPDSACSSGCSDGSTANLIRIPSGLMTSGILVAHEVGHVVHQQNISRNPGLRDDCSNGGAGWDINSVEFESCATAEGFASYLAIASWWNSDNSSVAPVGWGFNWETATPENNTSCAGNKGMALQVGKAFWDWDDVNNEAGAGVAGTNDDLDNAWDGDIAYAWNFFAAGTANRQNFESDSDGVNVRDYFANANSWWGSASMGETIRDHNCLTSQDDN